MDWSKYFVGVRYDEGGSIFIGTGKLRKDGTINFKNKSGDKTVEIVKCVARFMRTKLNKGDKPWFGYDIPNEGKLVLIKNGYDFEVFKRRPDVSSIRPVRDI